VHREAGPPRGDPQEHHERAQVRVGGHDLLRGECGQGGGDRGVRGRVAAHRPHAAQQEGRPPLPHLRHSAQLLRQGHQCQLLSARVTLVFLPLFATAICFRILYR
jgi:hypothetical protein